MSSKFTKESKDIIDIMNKNHTKCFMDYFSNSEIKTCTKLSYINTAQSLTVLYNDLINELTKFK